MRSRLFTVCLLSLLFGSVTSHAIEPALKENWKNFRIAHPFHVQIVGLSQPNDRGRRLLIVTEPPPHVTLQGLKDLAPELLGDATIERSGIGYNGWAKDALFELPPMSDTDLTTLVGRLHHYVFGTSYKAAAVAISATGETSRQDLNLQVPARNLALWLLHDGSGSAYGSILTGIIVGCLIILIALVPVLKVARKGLIVVGLLLAAALAIIYLRVGSDSTMRFVPVAGGRAHDLPTILRYKTSGVYTSQAPGLVVWSFPRSTALSDFTVEARQFALDSDLILGAIANDEQVAVIGRERMVPVDLLPPLRSETIMMLAGANTDELAQSYERTNILAGKYDLDKGLDWAPIYLSPQLIDTEYGSLLNITDQLLKSWSQHGETKYVETLPSEDGQMRFVDFRYPAPEAFPFSKALSVEAHTQTLTFNWNTKGVGYSIHDGPFEVFALNKTGSLPVDYLGAQDQKLHDAEDTAYVYFSGRNDPNLVRVVQYAALYQVFRRFQVIAPAPPQVHLPVSDTMKTGAALMVMAVAKLDQETTDKIKAFVQSGVGGDEEETRILLQELEQLAQDHADLSDFLQRYGKQGLLAVIDRLAAPRDTAGVSPQTLAAIRQAGSDTEREQLLRQMPATEQMNFEAQMIASSISERGQVLQLLTEAPLKTFMLGYVADMRRPERGWIGTSSIVVSYPIGEVKGAVGGHNLGAQISQFRASSDVSPGHVQVAEENGNKVILYSEKDAGKVGDLVRPTGRDGVGKTDDQLRDLLETKLKQAQDLSQSSTKELLRLPEGRPSGVRGLDDNGYGNIVNRAGFRPMTEQPTGDQRALADLIGGKRHTAVVVERLQSSGKYLIFHSTSQRIFEASDLVSAQDALLTCMKAAGSDGTSVRVHLRGFNAEQGRGFLESAELNSGPGLPDVSVRTIEDGRMEFSELREILTSDYDFKNARVEDVRTIVENDEGAQVEATIKVDSASKPTLFLKIRMLFKKGFAQVQNVVDIVKGRINEFLAQLGSTGGTLDLATSLSAFLRDMEKTNPGVKFHGTLSRRSRDIHIGHNNPGRFAASTAPWPA